MTWRTKLILGLLSALLSCAFILWILSKTIKPEMVRDYLGSQLTKLTSQKITIHGGVNWQLMPRPAIKMSHITIGDNSTASPYSINIDQLFLNLKITPLLHGQFIFNELKIEGLNATINTDLVSKVQQSIHTEDQRSPINHSQGQFAIEQFMLSHGTITLLNNQQTWLLTHLQVGAKQFSFSESTFPFQLKGELTLSSHDTVLAQTQINFDGNILNEAKSKTHSMQSFFNQAGIEGQLSLSQAKMNSIFINHLNANTVFKQGVVYLNPMTATLYHGEAIGDLNYNLAQHLVTINQTVTNLDAAALLSALSPQKILEGSLDLTLHSKTKLQLGEWPTNTEANGNLTLRNGMLLSFDLNRVINLISDKINRLLQTKQNLNAHNKSNNPLQIKPIDNPTVFEGKTPIKQLSITYVLNHGQFKSDPLLLQTERLELKGESLLDLITYQLSGRLNAQIIFNHDQVDSIQKLLGGSFPLLLGGTLTHPTILPDLVTINIQLGKAWLNTLKNPLKIPVDVLKKQIAPILKSQ